MAYQTKRQLRAELGKVKQDLYDKEERLKPARLVLDSLGYALESSWHSVFGKEYDWARPDGRSASTPEDVSALLAAREADLRAAAEEAYISGRRSAITAIIEALGIKGYSASKPLYSLFGKATQEEFAELNAAHADAFWADIQTALRVRAERRRSESDDATEAKIAGLFAPKEKPKSAFDENVGGFLNSTYVSNSDVERLAEQVSKFSERLDAQEKSAEGEK